MPKTVPQRAPIPSRQHVGVVRRLQALAVAGWTRPYLAAELAISECHLTRVYAGRVSFRQLAVRVCALYDRLRDEEPPYTKAGCITRGRAIANGWLDAHAWSPATIDDPDARPLTRRVRICIEDLQWMADTGESFTGACQRLRRPPPTVFRTLDRAHRLDLWRRLAAREAA